jgi:putative permease
MLNIFKKWYERYLIEEEAILLLVLLAVSLLLLMTVGDILVPVLASIVLAYLMQGMASQLLRFGLPQWVGVSISFVVFIGAFFAFTLGLLPLAWRQLVGLAGEMPRMIERGKELLGVLPTQYPEMFSQLQIEELVGLLQAELALLGQSVLTISFNSIPGLLAVMVYMVLIPILVFFFMKDRQLILDWFSGFLPNERPLLKRIWNEMDTQVANYTRGKALEILIVGGASYIAFTWMDLRYAALLGLLVGLSVIVPYIGAAIVTLPVVMVGFFQWGLGSEFYYLFGVYALIQIIDGNVLVPLLFSEAVNLHPVAIILAVLFFGGIWGLWGVFFAIPLATLIKAIINAWPRPEAVAKVDSELEAKNLD